MYFRGDFYINFLGEFLNDFFQTKAESVGIFSTFSKPKYDFENLRMNYSASF